MSVRRAVLEFTAGGLVAMLLVGIAVVYLTHLSSVRDAERSAAEIAELQAHLAVEPNLTRDVIIGDTTALTEFDRIVRKALVHAPTERIKIIDAAGRIVYSDEPSLIGEVHQQSDDQRVLDDGGTATHIVDLSNAEHRLERGRGPLIEIAVGIRATDGEPLIYESYIASDAVRSDSRALWLKFAPALLGGLVLLQAAQTPLAWSLARRVRAWQRDRDALVLRNLRTGTIERRRIATDLHDSVVPSITGTSFTLDAAADDVSRLGASALADELREASRTLRSDVRKLRSLLGDIYPTTLRRDGLPAALAELARAVEASGIIATVDASSERFDADYEQLVFRVAQEALRNVTKHAQASNVAVRLRVQAKRVQLAVADDGRGFTPDERASSEPHLGLQMMRDLVTERNGTITFESRPGAGSTITMEVTLP